MHGVDKPDNLTGRGAETGNLEPATSGASATPIAGVAPAATTATRAESDVFADAKAWAAFADATEADSFFRSWLALQCRMIPDAVAGALFATRDDGAFVTAAHWPTAGAEDDALRAAAHAAASGRAPQLIPEEGMSILSVPIERENRICMIAALRLLGPAKRDTRAALRRLRWGTGWLSAHLAGLDARDAKAFVGRAQRTLDLVALANEHVRHDAAAMAVANELLTDLDIDNASIGLVQDRGRSAKVRLVAFARAAWFRKKSKLVAEIENAMGEAIDQACTVTVPEQPDSEKRISVALDTYAESAGSGAAAAFILSNRDGPCGALVLERRACRNWEPETIAFGEALGAMVGPALMLKRRQRRWVSGRIVDATGNGIKAVLGHRRPSLKLAVLAVAGFLAYISLVDGTFRVSADAVLEGEVQRVAAAPFDGFVKEARVRAGDAVTAGDVLAELDDRDLRLEVLRWKSEYARLRQQQRAALASLERSEVALIAAQIEQARAQLDLAQARLERTQVVAPVGGIVIAGDLSQRLGSPVTQGEVLFEIAPLDDYRVAIQVEERDMRHVEAGQTGQILLAGRADAALPFEITRLTSVAQVVEGTNAFRVEAKLTGAEPRIRPGMEGVAKIDVEPRPFIWIWTRSLIDWLRVFVWKWTP